jgi:hypothetical protein
MVGGQWIVLHSDTKTVIFIWLVWLIDRSAWMLSHFPFYFLLANLDLFIQYYKLVVFFPCQILLLIDFKFLSYACM